ncbi:hypothetical protein [Brevibacillus borstelensis]|uniref:hypothetical protein n=1 Tax=Brevibacillus borstelensis TaxID=45462 RepID=UPI00203AECF1|nr:hypothetical protein [Brevibacillus borstelensis]MCM3589622.1 hypothetical protein [Brevibacillus borstelensis]
MQILARNGYTAEQVIKALHAPQRTIRFRYELLDKKNQFKAHLRTVKTGRVGYHALAQIKRTASFSLREDGTINFLSDRIKPYVLLRMGDGGWTEWPQGVFVLSTPPRKADETGSVWREVEAYDLLQVLVDDKVDDRYTVKVGANYIVEVKKLLDSAGITGQNLTATDKTLPADRDWDPGTAKLHIINDLLGAINYRSLWFDEHGIAVAQPYVTPASRASEYTYRDDDKSVIFPDMEQSLDLFAVPNKWVLVVSEPDRPPLVSTYTNSNPESPTSTVSRGRTIVDYREYEEAADQSTLDARAQRIASEASQVYESVEFETAIMPMHSDMDCLTLEFTTLGISDKYIETSWEFDLRAGARMRHRIRKVVNV